MIGSLGWQELLIILVILALLFGASRVAGLGGALGRGIREFRREARADDDESGEDSDDSSGAATGGGDTSAGSGSSSGGGSSG
ncbi:MAG: twin-arginine translocase TatA/TatE family subunit [Chloroflexi bacterium]|nr:twin-arginine translocase TatA/TatE family subunit [Chloroflexota bacterium]